MPRQDLGEQVSCPDCQVSVSARNLSRHRRAAHGTSDADRLCRATFENQPSTPRSRSNSRETTSDLRLSGVISTPQGGTQLPSCEGAPSYVLADAAKALLQQHHLTTEEQLLGYLNVNFPEIPAIERMPLIVGAITGAQLASKFHFIVDQNRNSKDSAKRDMAANAGSSISFWNLGLSSPARVTPNTTVPEAETSTAVPGTKSLPDLPNLLVPIPFHQSCKDYDIVQAAILEARLQEVCQSAAATATSIVVPSDQESSSVEQQAGDVRQQPTVEPYVPETSFASSSDQPTYTPSAIVGASRPNIQSKQLEEEEEDLVIEMPATTSDFDEPLPPTDSMKLPVFDAGTRATTAMSVGEARPIVTSGKGKGGPSGSLTTSVTQSSSRRAASDRVSPRRSSPRHSSPPRESKSRRRSPRRSDRDDSPPRRLVLTGANLRQYLDFQRGRPSRRK